MDNFYFTFWIKRYGRNAFKELSDKICTKISVPLEIKEKMNVNEYLFHYFYVVYYTITLNYLGLNTKQISLLLDMSLTPGTSKLFPPDEILKVQKDNIPDIIKFIEKEIKMY